MTFAQVAIGVWLTGVVLFLMPVVAGFWQMRRLRARALPWTEGQARAQTLASALGVHRKVDAMLHDAVTGPMTCGVLRPSIILPVSAHEWDVMSLRCALRHEIEHVARWDFLTLCLARMVCAVYWFHPLVWAAWRRMRLEAERACDDAVVREDDAGDYASLLVSMAQRDPASTRRPLLAMAGRNDLAARVAAVLDHDQTRGRIGRRRVAGLMVAGAVATLGVAPITVARAMPQTPSAQTPLSAAAPPQTFAAASIKRNGLEQIRQMDGQMIATNVTVRDLLILAFGVRDIAGGPWWLGGYRFDIVASMPSDNLGPGQGSKSLQAFLTERFKLVAHRGSKDVPIYALVAARPDGRLGPQITPSPMDCRPDAVRARFSAIGLPADTGGRPTCGISSTFGQMAGRGVTLAELVRNLPAHLGGGIRSPTTFDRVLTDRTGVSDRFDFTLEWTPDAGVQSTAATPTPGQNRPFVSALESTAPNFLTALEEQLGLTIESQLAPIPVLVIDSIEEPRAN